MKLTPKRGLLLAILVLAAIAPLVMTLRSKPKQVQPVPPGVEVVQVIQKDVPVYREWIGTLDGMVNAEIKARVTGYLVRQVYTEGSVVRAGQPLFEIDPRPFQAALDEARATLAQAEGRLAEANSQLLEAQAQVLGSEANQGRTQLDVNRYTPLAKAGGVTEQDLDNAVQANLAEIGITVTIQQHDSGTFWSLGDQKSGDSWKKIQIIINRFSMQPDPSFATDWFTPEQIGVWNWERWNSPEFGELNKQAKIEQDEKKRNEMYIHMQDLMEEGGAYVFLTHGVTGIGYSDKIVPALLPHGGPVFHAFKSA